MAEEKQLSVEDLKMWVEFVTFEKINGVGTYRKANQTIRTFS